MADQIVTSLIQRQTCLKKKKEAGVHVERIKQHLSSSAGPLFPFQRAYCPEDSSVRTKSVFQMRQDLQSLIKNHGTNRPPLVKIT